MRRNTMEMNRKLRRAGAVFTALMLACIPALAGEFEARTDRNRILEGESLQLLLRYRGGMPNGEPDLSVLERDFDLLDVRQSQRTSVVNGRVDQSFDWIVTLEPRSSGEIEIPSISLGGDASRPLSIRVEETAMGGSAPSAPAFLEVEVDDDEPYVQGKVTLTARLFLDAGVRGGALNDCSVRGAIVQRLGEDASYRTRRDGRELQVIERTYAIFPQESGVLEIPPVRFEGTQRSEGGRRRPSLFDDSMFGADPFGGTMMGGSLFEGMFGGGGRPIRARSDSITLNVKARPEEAGGSWWLPAHSVELIEHFEEEPPEFRVGEPIKRTLAIQAVGLSGAQMPELELPDIEGIRQYAGESRDETYRADDQTVAVKVTEVTLIPGAAGRASLPAIELEWWDVEADERRVATIPSRQVDVLDAAGNVVAGSIAPSPPARPSQAETVVTDGPLDPVEQPQHAIARGWIAAGAGLSVLLALFIVRRRRRARAEGERSSPDPFESAREPVPLRRAAESRLRRACEADDPRAAISALMELGRACFPENPPACARGLAERLDSVALAASIGELDRARFAAGETAWFGASLWNAWRAAWRGSGSKARARRAVLPDLYPATQ